MIKNQYKAKNIYTMYNKFKNSEVTPLWNKEIFAVSRFKRFKRVIKQIWTKQGDLTNTGLFLSNFFWNRCVINNDVDVYNTSRSKIKVVEFTFKELGKSN